MRHFYVLCFVSFVSFVLGCHKILDPRTYGTKSESVSEVQVPILEDIQIKNYFAYMDSLVVAHDSITPFPLTEHLLVRANPWIIDTLENTDYYRLMAKDSFVYDQKNMIVLPKGASLKIPDSLVANRLLNDFRNTYVDVNIPEYKLRIYQDSTLIYTFPIRVGRNAKRYLAQGDRVTDLRTITGKGIIAEHHRNPHFYNPVNGKRFYVTKRDDEKTTSMPQIPWTETEISGICNGQMIHPTTNPKTLGKAYSNGCIGTKEADAWTIYYYTPLNTPIHIRYELKGKDENGVEVILEDIYGYGDIP
ncbi:L,D-transpeptidase [Flagellimonas sp. S3867]|uniref:L,D-transpeptidase n=1 Tax=Flagellimonas sp. S3867 TaxID=2768063 RepID=UPI00168870A1|nr:L,D-transpeptidase [Flagellimonas sp. S3867]